MLRQRRKRWVLQSRKPHQMGRFLQEMRANLVCHRRDGQPSRVTQMKPYLTPLRAPSTVMAPPCLSGHLAGGRPFTQPFGTFIHRIRALLGIAPAGARTTATTQDEARPTCAPTVNDDDIPTFHCPLWPGCGCPGGTVMPDCPGLANRRGV